MKVHHLNCGTMHPALAERHVCHVLLVETNKGLVLVDSGYGTHDIAEPRTRIGPIRHLIRPALVASETAAAQVIALGFNITDVRHIVATHLDLDHIGGVSDFPHAQLHTTAAEVVSAYSPRLRSRLRYNRSQLPSKPETIRSHGPGPDSWRGFVNVTSLSEIDDDIAIIPLPGHSMGHACVAVNAGYRWVLHCGDAFYHRNTIQQGLKTPLTSRLFERVAADDYRQVKQNHLLLKMLESQRDPALLVVSAHDHQLLGDAQRTAVNPVRQRSVIIE